MTRWLACLVLALAACSRGVELDRQVTLSVENTACAATCPPLHILAFPAKQPATPGGLWSVEVGTATAPTECFVMPSTASFTVSGPNGVEQVYTWTPADSVAIGYASDGNRMVAVPATHAFVPLAADGWSVRLPANTAVVATDRCAP